MALTQSSCIPVEFDRGVIVLHEVNENDVLLTSDEAAELQAARLSVKILASVSAEDVNELRPYRVHGNHQVGYFQLSTGRFVRIESKVPIANVFSLLAVAYRFYADKPPFLERTVPYSAARAQLLQTLVEHLATLIETLLREGLLRRYVEQEENLSVVRGRLLFEQQVRKNLVRGNRMFCRFTTSDVDNVENRIVLWTLLLLQRSCCWQVRLRQRLQAQIMHFGGVSAVPISPGRVPELLYDRLSTRYCEIHLWCRFFIDQMALINESGTIEFRGFRLNMFELFERFVFCVFQKAAHKNLGVRIDKAKAPLDREGRVGIHPDILIKGRSSVAVADAKYKLTRDDVGRHPDLYQVVAYSTALGLIDASHLPQALLIYPATERTTELDGDLHILTSARGEGSLTVRTLWFDLACENVVDSAVNLADTVIALHA